MRVYYTNGTYSEYKTATHWDTNGSDDWVELLTEDEEIIAVLIWKHVIRIEIMEVWEC